MLHINIVALFPARNKERLDNLLNCISKQDYLKIRHVSWLWKQRDCTRMAHNLLLSGLLFYICRQKPKAEENLAPLFRFCIELWTQRMWTLGYSEARKEMKDSFAAYNFSQAHKTLSVWSVAVHAKEGAEEAIAEKRVCISIYLYLYFFFVCVCV